MADWQRGYLRVVKAVLPSPFTIAVLLTVVTFVLAGLLTGPAAAATEPYLVSLLGYWNQGFWELLAFSMQMVLILLLGHTLALSPFFSRFIEAAIQVPRTTAQAAAWVSFLAMAVGLLNWGLGLIFGAILARKLGERAARLGSPLNYPLIGAAAYSTMMVWHGGFSGSAPLVVAEADHFLVEQMGQISIRETLLAPMNLAVAAALLLLVPAVLYALGRRAEATPAPELPRPEPDEQAQAAPASGAERIDHTPYVAWGLGLLIVGLAVYLAWQSVRAGNFTFISLNFINFLLFGLGIWAHGSVHRFLAAVQEALGGTAGIIVQFPLYAGIMGIMKYSGLVTVFSESIVSWANETTFPLFTFFSAAVVNTFVPSGGGQWAVQGPIVTEAAHNIGVPMPKAIMALAYGDQLTNMLQPFWALPLLGITRLKAKDILPYTLVILAVGLAIFAAALLIF